MFCPRCGTPAHADLRFCTACGAPLIPSAPAGPAGPPFPAPEAAAAAVERRSAPATRVALVLVLLVVLIAALAAAYLLYRRSSAGMGGNLRVVNVAFLQSEDGAARAAAPYAPGDTVYVKYEVLGFAKDKDRKIDLLLRVVASDPDNLALYPPWEKELVQEVPAGRPVNGSFNLGLRAYVPPGAYKVEIKVHDKVNNTDAEAVPAFQVEAPAVAPAAGLEMRDFALSLSQDGPPAEAPVLQGGGTVYMRWRIFGLQAKGGNVNMRVALKVLGPGGNTVVDAPKYVLVDETFYYRPRTFFLAMSGHVTLPGEFPKGAYTALFTVTDEVAQAQIQYTAKLELR